MPRRLLCFSLVTGQKCKYDKKCAYAHSLYEQDIDENRLESYNRILTKSFEPMDTQDYTVLSIQTRFCDQCIENKCAGGYNCRNGCCTPELKLCNDDFNTGLCKNPTTNRSMSECITNKFSVGKQEYVCCDNGIHLSVCGFVPYNKYVDNKEQLTKAEHTSTRYLYDPALFNLFKSRTNDGYSDSSTDDSFEDLINGVCDVE